MSVSKLILGTMTVLVASAAAASAAPASDSSVTAASGRNGASHMSAAAKEQILDKSHIQLASVKRPRPFTPESGPTFAQWMGQVKSPRWDGRGILFQHAPDGDVNSAFTRNSPLVG